MNHYPHHIGDFDKATRHLTRIERSIYRDLIELYYDTEKPLTLDRAALCRRVLARTNEESTAVEQVLSEFFNETPQGWYHARCEIEIEKYLANQSEKARAGRASAAAKALKLQLALNASSTSVEHPSSVESTEHQQNSTNREPGTGNREPEPIQQISAVPAEPETATQISVPPREIVPFEKIIDLYHEILPELPRCKALTKKRRGHIRQRWMDGLPDLETWRSYFNHVRKSKFLMGLAQPTNGRPPFRASIDWLANEENVVKVSENRYA